MVFHFGNFETGIVGALVIFALLFLSFMFPVTRRAVGFAMILLGLAFSFTVIGYIIGLPMIMIGMIMVAIGYFLHEKVEE